MFPVLLSLMFFLFLLPLQLLFVLFFLTFHLSVLPLFVSFLMPDFLMMLKSCLTFRFLFLKSGQLLYDAAHNPFKQGRKCHGVKFKINRGAQHKDGEQIHLPRLASGTVVPPRAGEFAAILGDNPKEPEVVSPLSTMKQALKEAMLEVNGAGGGDIRLTVNLEGKAIYDTVVRRNRMEKNRTGKNLLLV